MPSPFEMDVTAGETRPGKIKKASGPKMGGRSLEDIGKHFTKKYGGQERTISKEAVRQMLDKALIHFLKNMAKAAGNFLSDEQAKELLEDPEMEEAIGEIILKAEMGLSESVNMRHSMRLTELAGLD